MDTFHTYLDEKSFSAKSFWQFLHENKAVVIVSALTILFVYGAKLTSICFGVDTELRIATNGYLNWLSIGRFGLVGLQKLWTNFLPQKELFNPYFAVILGCIFLFFSALLWCFLIELFSCGRIKKSGYIPFAVMFISHQVWCEQIYFVLQSAECLCITFLSPIAVYSLFRGVEKSSAQKTMLGILLTVFSISVYQGVLILIYCGIFALFVLYKENTNHTEKEYTRFCLMLLGVMLFSVFLYFALNKAVQMMFHIEKSDYLSKMIGNDRKSVVWTFLNLGVYVYKLVFAHCPLVIHIAEPIMARTARTGWKAVEQIRGCSLMSNILFAPSVIIYMFFVLQQKQKSFFYLSAAVCVPLCCFVLVFLGGGDAPLRSQYVLPFSLAFMMLYDISMIKKRTAYLVAIALFSLCGIKQTLVCAMLNYSDVMRYEADVRLSSEIAERIAESNADKETPVFLYGVHHPQFSGNYIKGEVCAYSPFEWVSGEELTDSTSRGIAFMKTQGYNFTAVKGEDSQLIKKAREAAESMQNFPYPNSVQNRGDVVIVRLSESSYNPKTE